MYTDQRVCIVVPAVDEEKLIARTLGTLPDWVDRIVVIDDCSSDSTVEIVKEIAWNEELQMKSFFVRAPDGVLIEIVEADPLPDASWIHHGHEH